MARSIVALSVPQPRMSSQQQQTRHVRKVFHLLCKWSHLAQTFLKASLHFTVGELPQKHLRTAQVLFQQSALSRGLLSLGPLSFSAYPTLL
jgi:hypothetical protein